MKHRSISADSSQQRPNILIIMTDQQRWDSLGCYGADWIDTPNIDRLAAGGTLYERCYVNNPICTPSRASMLTGKPITGHGVLRLHDVLPDDEVLLPARLQQLGYETALFGKLHVSGRVEEERRRHPNDGFDIYEWCMEASISMDSPFNGYSRWLKERDPAFHARLKRLGRRLTHIPRELHFTHWAAERTVSFLEGHARIPPEHSDEGKQPFFCMMSVFDPHNPYDDMPAEYLERVRDDLLPMPEVAAYEREHRINAIAREQRDGYLGPYATFGAEDFRAMRRGYFASIALLDDEVGRVLDTLDRTGLSRNTLVIFTSDHGDMLGDHGLLVKGAFFYDACTRVPLILRQPEVTAAGLRTRALVQPHDISATVLAAAGMETERIRQLMPDATDIRIKAGDEKDGEHAFHQEAVCEYRQTGIDRTGRYFDPPIDAAMITDGSWKLNLYYPVPGTPPGRSEEGQLFDLREDPGEIIDRWEREPDVRNRMLGRLRQWQTRQEPIRPRRARSAVPERDCLFDNRLKPAKRGSR